jgi:plastocyanin
MEVTKLIPSRTLKMGTRIAVVTAIGAVTLGCGGSTDSSDAPVATAVVTTAPYGYGSAESGSTEYGSTEYGSATTAPGTTAPATTEPVSTADHVVVTEGFSYSPASLQIAVGETVEFQVGPGHNLTWDCAGESLFGVVTRTFDEPGTYGYCCTFHEAMSGIIIVE